MHQITGSTAPTAIPHTAAETAALLELYEHVGTQTQPNCSPCVATLDGCAEGRALRRAVRDATARRSRPGGRR
jgi:hypothetical protein